MHMMPGLEALAAIRKEYPEATIIILTTYSGNAENAKKLGARAYWLKSELDKELLGTITRRAHRKISKPTS